ncbi:hypothetical protein PR202_ga24257 [Eleusine coracana subsp. coracana]|uniref:Uncharacterized protein n=1 Tax=Eleusine coracana subsp. coracana TaxID=191504 RepID=A0AAV5D6A7_ELECO|nr:hypothetical protein PR202_ga24257 [Eleusine coracana subsp. coracana]
MPRRVQDERVDGGGRRRREAGVPPVPERAGEPEGRRDDERVRVVQAGGGPGLPGGHLRGDAGEEPRPGVLRGGQVPRPRAHPAHQERRHQAERRALRQPHRLPP